MSALRKHNVTPLQSTYKLKHEQNEQLALKKRKGLVRRLTVFGLVVAITAYVIISTLLSQHVAMKEKELEKKELESKLAELQEEKVLLEEEIVKLNDDEYIAKIARRDYFLSKEGEIIFKISEDSSSY
ncbi:septum formation initiator family protein [Bacillus timonensis]|nr:septum formation initiator family protein [Bacillus timonensis]